MEGLKKAKQSVKCFFGFHKFEDVKHSFTFMRGDGSTITVIVSSSECQYCGESEKPSTVNKNYDDPSSYGC